MPIGTDSPRLTRRRAALISLAHRYLGQSDAVGVTQVEIQKLMYFLQKSGETLRLQYEKGRYGPYAANLEYVL